MMQENRSEKADGVTDFRGSREGAGHTDTL